MRGYSILLGSGADSLPDGFFDVMESDFSAVAETTRTF